MHVHGRALSTLVPLAIEGLDDDEVATRGVDAFEVIEGELVAGLALGWNFGDGHLHHEQLLEVLQDQCDIEPGDVRAVMIESQPFLEPTMHWRIVDAAAGLMAEGRVATVDLLTIQPWGGDVDLGRVAGPVR
jgi:hypothetical protein